MGVLVPRMIELMATTVAGLGLFFAGLRILTENMKKLDGGRLRDALAVGIGKPFRGFSWGLLAGGLTHTATITVFALSSLLAAGLTTVKATIPVLLGVNIGTSALVFLATLDIQSIALIITGVAGIAMASEKVARFRPVVSAVFGVGMLFVGIGMLQDGATDVVQQAWAERFMSLYRDYYMIGFLAGALLRFVAQSASAVSILAIALTATGTFDIEQTVMTIYGANFGAAISTWTLSLAVRGHARHIAYYQVLFDIVGAVILVPLFYLEVYGGVPLVLGLVTSLSGDVQQQMAIVFLLFNVVAALAMVALIPIASVITRRCRYDVAPSSFITIGAVAGVVLATGLYELSRSHVDASSPSIPVPKMARLSSDAYSGHSVPGKRAPMSNAGLENDPQALLNNTQARQSLQSLFTGYIELAKGAQAAGRLRDAEVYVSRAQDVLYGYDQELEINGIDYNSK